MRRVGTARTVAATLSYGVLSPFAINLALDGLRGIVSAVGISRLWRPDDEVVPACGRARPLRAQSAAAMRSQISRVLIEANELASVVSGHHAAEHVIGEMRCNTYRVWSIELALEPRPGHIAKLDVHIA
jgi:hypothetical protein